jgi:serine/threonine protein kinase
MITLKNAVNRTPITDSVGANSYSAPEVFFDTEYDAACDLWSLGPYTIQNHSQNTLLDDKLYRNVCDINVV